MSSQARYELESRTSLGGQKVSAGKVVARIGKREITEDDIDEALKNSPAWLKTSLSQPERRNEFIRDYVGQEVLYEKAKRLGLDTKEEIRQILEQLKKQVVVEQFLGSAIRQKLELITPDDIKLYYEANKNNFVEPAQIKVGFLSFEDESRKDEIAQKIKNRKVKSKRPRLRRETKLSQGLGMPEMLLRAFSLRKKAR